MWRLSSSSIGKRPLESRLGPHSRHGMCWVDRWARVNWAGVEVGRLCWNMLCRSSQTTTTATTNMIKAADTEVDNVNTNLEDDGVTGEMEERNR